MNRLILLVAFILGAFGTAHAEQLDPSFSGGIVALNQPFDSETVALLELPDGKVLNVNSQPTSLDSDLFLNFVTLPQSGNGTSAIYQGVNLPGIVASVLDSKGRRVVVGATSAGPNGTDFRVARFLPDGSFDNSFGSNGRVAVDLSNGNDYALAVALDKDDNIVVAGSATLSGTDTDFAVVLLRASNGSVLNAVLIPFDLAPGQRLDQANAVAVANDGRILVGGVAYDDAIDKFRIGLARLTPTGSIDTSFCSPSCNFPGTYGAINSGRRVYFFGSGDAHSDQLFGMESIGNGNFYIVGTSSPSDGSGPKAAIANINSAGNYVTEAIGVVGSGPLGQPKNYRAVKSADGLGTRLLVSGDAGNGRLYMQAFSAGLIPIANYGNCLFDNSGFCFSAATGGDVGPNKAGPVNLDKTGRPLFTGSFQASTKRAVLLARFTNDTGPKPDLIFRTGFQ